MAYPFFPQSTADGPYGRLAPGCTLQNAPRILSAGFGGGYEQRTGDGINTNKRTLAARFEALDLGEANALESFLVERAGYKPFFCKVPGYEAGILFTCATWTRNYNDAGLENLTATFVECFDP